MHRLANEPDLARVEKILATNPAVRVGAVDEAIAMCVLAWHWAWA